MTGMTIGEAFRRVAADRPDVVAVACGDRRISYAELDVWSNRLANHLLRRGLRPEEPVAVLDGPGEALVVALLAVIKAGGCYLGLDAHQPADRTAALLAAAGVRLVLTAGARPAGPGPAGGGAVDWLTVPALDLAAEPASAPAITAAPAQLAYLGYTSGSTGAPKAAAIPHQAVLRLVRDADFLPVRSEDVFLRLAPLAFDASTLEIWAPLLNGARLVVPEQPLDQPAGIADLVRRAGITVLWLTAGLFHQFGAADLAELAGLGWLLAGGDVLSVPNVNAALAALPGVTLVNGYGPTENTTFTCCYRIDGAQVDRVPIGFPISGSTVRLLDEQLHPVADGAAGELYTGGLGLARGYLGQPGITAERFLPDPFSTGGRLYRTGDLARRRPDGALDFLGRQDDQVKIRGFRVEAAEVEGALRGLAEVADAAVLALPSRFGRRLVGFAVPASGGTAAGIRRRLAALLPDYAVPSAIVLLDELPLNHNGKVDRTRLAQHTGRDRPADLASAFRPAGNETERLVAETWQLLLDLDGLGMDDDFFELGGHSLVAAAITAELGSATGLELRPRQLYEHSTVAGLAALLDELRTRQAGRPDQARTEQEVAAR